MTTYSRLERYERRTEWPLAMTAVLFLAMYSVGVIAQPRGGADHLLRLGLWSAYSVFVVDYVARLYLARARWKWFVHNLPLLAIVLLPFLQELRLLSLAVVINALQRAVGHTFRGRVIIYTICGTVFTLYATALAMLQAERGHPGAQVETFGDALWWAITTVTAVGYGDITPVTTTGRMVAAALMVAGISLLAVVTATLASWIIERVGEEDAANQAATVAHIEELLAEIRRLAEVVADNSRYADGEARDGGLVKGGG